MANDWYTLPDGSEINIPANASRDQLTNLFGQLSQEFPDSIGRAWSTYGQPAEEEEGNIFGKVYQAIENVPRGLIDVPLMGLQGIAALATPHADTAAEKNLRQFREWVHSGVDPKYRDSYIAQIGLAAGQFIPLIFGGGALATTKALRGIPKLLAAKGVPAPLAEMGAQYAAMTALSVPMHMGDQAARIAEYEERTGEDVSAIKELMGLGGAAVLGATEAAPLYAMGAGAGFLGKAIRQRAILGGAGAAEKVGPLQAFLRGAPAEAAQEAGTELGHTIIARALYDDEALAEVGRNVMDAGIVGGGAGGLVSVLANLAMRGAGGRAYGLDMAAEDMLQQEDQRRKGRYRDRVGVLEAQEGPERNGRFFADPTLSEEERARRYENRVKYHQESIVAQEALRAEQTPEDQEFIALTEEQLRAEAERRTQEDISGDMELWQEAQNAEIQERQDAGATFAELDELSERPIEELVELLDAETITPEMFSEILVADRINSLGGESRNELRDFAVRNAEVNNRYNAGAVAGLIIGGDPSLVTGAESSYDLFGGPTAPIAERFTNAIRMLAPRLSAEGYEESAALLTQQKYLMPAQVNQVVEDASQVIGNFKAKEVYDSIYGFRGGASAYDRVQRTFQEKDAEWRESDTGQLELRLVDPIEQEITEEIQDDAAKAVWTDENTFRKSIAKLLRLKNIDLTQDSRLDTTGVNSAAFRNLINRVTGKDKLKDLNDGQREALFGHIANIPTFRQPTLLPDLTRASYTPKQASLLLQELLTRRNKDGSSWLSLSDKDDTGNIFDATGQFPDKLTNLDQAYQLVRHLREAGYIDINRRGPIRIRLKDNTRPFGVPPTDVASDAERQAAETQVQQETKTASLLADKIQKLKTAIPRYLSQMNLPGLSYQLSADLDPIYNGIVGTEGIIANPANMAQSMAALDGPNSRLLINLSRIDPDGTRPVNEIIDELEHEVFHAYDEQGYWFEDELRTMDGRAFDTIVPETVNEEAHNNDLNFIEYAESLYPDLNRQDLMSEARSIYMSSLARGQLPKGRTAGKVNSLGKKMVSLLTGSIEAGRESGLQDVMSIYTQFKTGQIGRRGDPDPGRPRSLRLSRYADPKHLQELKLAIAENDTAAQDRITKEILDEKVHMRRMADPPEPTWIETLTNKILMEEEIEALAPGEIPAIGKDASDAAIDEYFRMKKGGKPYTMPAAIKHKFRSEQQWEPSKDLNDLMDQYSPDTPVDDALTSETVIDTMAELSDLSDQLTPEDIAGLSADQVTKKQFDGSQAIMEKHANVWSDPWRIVTDAEWRSRGWNLFRQRVADGAFPVERLEQLHTRLNDGVRRLANTSAVAMVRFRNSAMNTMRGVQQQGAVRWIGTPLDGYHQIVTYDQDTKTLDQMFGLLQSAQDRLWTTRAMTAQLFLDHENNKLVAQQFLDRSLQEGDQDNIRFFEGRLKERQFRFGDENSKPLDKASAEQIVTRIKAEAPHVAEFMESFFKHNQNNLDWLVETEQITPEMREYLKNMAYVPLYKNIGMERAYPLGSTGRSQGQKERVLKWGVMREGTGTVFDHALESVSDIENVDLVRNILYSQQAMIRDGFSNVAALRVLNSLEELTAAGMGQQSMQVPASEAGGIDVLRVLRNGREEFHRLADPDLANATMLLGFSATNGWFNMAKISGQVLRMGIITFPGFVYRNFYKDADQRAALFGGSKGAFFPVFESLKKATETGLLERAREAGLVTGGGGAYYNVQDMIEGAGPIDKFLRESDSPLGKSLRGLGLGDTGYFGIGQRKAREAKREARYEEIMGELDAGRIPFRNPLDYASFISVMYRNIRDVGEVTARMSAHDITLARTGNPAQAMLDGLEIMNYGRRGDDPRLNVISSMVPFMHGGITGLDTFIRTFTGAPDAPGAHLVSPLMNDQAAKQIRNRALMRGLHITAAMALYFALTHDDEAYKRASEVDKMNNWLIRIGDKVIKLPVSFTVGMFFKVMPESLLRVMFEEEYDLGDARAEFVDQTRRQLDFHLFPQIYRPIHNAMVNYDDFRRQPIVPEYLHELPAEYQRTDYTSDSMVGLAKVAGLLPFDTVLSSPQKLEYLFRSYFGYTGIYVPLMVDRIVRPYLGKSIAGTRYDFSPYSLLSGEGIENFPIISEVVDDWRVGRGREEEFNDIRDQLTVYERLVAKIGREESPEALQKYMEENRGIGDYSSTVSAFRQYMREWRQRRNQVLRSTVFSEDRKREIIYDMIEEQNRVLDGMLGIKSGIKDRSRERILI